MNRSSDKAGLVCATPTFLTWRGDPFLITEEHHLRCLGHEELPGRVMTGSFREPVRYLVRSSGIQSTDASSVFGGVPYPWLGAVRGQAGSRGGGQ
jgi:hypothetical protein